MIKLRRKPKIILLIILAIGAYQFYKSSGPVLIEQNERALACNSVLDKDTNDDCSTMTDQELGEAVLYSQPEG